ncbi:hypothetical protein GOBAR_DD23646 [Gossypium barbadense]|nr:hypothetical protein GOBAR_DD23646 [Gossypium barbadense]
MEMAYERGLISPLTLHRMLFCILRELSPRVLERGEDKLVWNGGRMVGVNFFKGGIGVRGMMIGVWFGAGEGLLIPRKALLTDKRRVQRHMTMDAHYHMCGETEDVEHVLRGCFWVKSVWRQCCLLELFPWF